MSDGDNESGGKTSTFISNVPMPPNLELRGNLAKNWKKWKQLWDAYEVVTKLKEENDESRVATFITCIGLDALEIHNSLPYKDETERTNMKIILQLWTDYCVGKTNVIYERYVFNNRAQEPGENIDAYSSALRYLVSTCEYNNLSDELIRDRIVCGIQDNSVRRKLLQEPGLTLEKCIDLCKAAEATSVQIKAMAACQIESDAEVNLVKKRSKPRDYYNERTTPQNFIKNCRYCGLGHERKKEVCPAYGKTCSMCGMTNHFAKKCRNTRKVGNQMHKRVNAINQEEEYNHNMSEEEIMTLSLETEHNQINTVNESNFKSKILVTMEIESRPVEMQIDSGATCNVIPEKFVPRDTPILASNQKLSMYSKATMPVLGTCKVRVFNPKIKKGYKVHFVVVKGNYPILLGSRAAQQMKLLTVQYDNIQRINNIAACLPYMDGSKNLTKTDLLGKYRDVFEGRGCMEGKLHLEVDQTVSPVVVPPRRVPIAMKTKLKQELQRLESSGAIKKVTQPTDWVSSLVIVKKPNGNLRICIDPLHLNKALKRSHYPLPVFEDILPELSSAKVFSKVDLKEGFLQISLDEESSFLTTFQTPWGRYRYLRLPFGLSPSPEYFQQKLDQNLEGLQGIFKIADDILITGVGDTIEDANRDHDRNLINLLERCRERHIKLNIDKFELRSEDMPFSGHSLTPEGLKPDPAKIEAVKKMERPIDVAGVQRIVGMVKYLSKFLSDLSDICEPLRRLTHKDVPWEWKEEQEKAFNNIKQAVTSAPVLRYFDPVKQTEGQGDASSKGLGFSLMQEGQPITYSSRALTTAEQNYSQIEKELLALVFGMEKNHLYVYGRRIILWTDHKPLVSIVNKPLADTPRRLQRLLLRLQNYDVEIRYKKGTEMYIADTLSRAALQSEKRSTIEEELESVHMIDYIPMSKLQLQEIQRETDKDEILQKLKAVIIKGWPENKYDLPPELHTYFNCRDELAVQDSVVFKGLRCVIPTVLRQKIRERLHSTHIGIQGCLRRAREVVYWPGMSKELVDYIAKCEICNTFQYNQQKEPLICHSVPSRPWQKVGSDIFTFENRDYLCTVDYYSSYFEVDRLYEKTASEVIKKTKRNFAIHGIPDQLFSDNMPYNSREFKDFARKYKFEHRTSSPEYPQSNGKVENAIKTAKKLMRKAKEAGGDYYLSLLDWRNTPSEGMQSSPVQRLFGRRTRTLLPTAAELLKPKIVENVAERLVERKDTQRRYYNKNSKELPVLVQGQTVRIRPSIHTRSGRWRKAQIQRQVGIRSYEVQTEDGSTLRRNRRHLRATKEPFFLQVEENILPSNHTPASHASRTSREDNQEMNPVVDHYTESPPIDDTNDTQVEQPNPPQQDTSENTCVTRYGRASVQPSYLKDYVTS